MRAVVQRVKQASVTIGDKVSGHIKEGLLIFLGVTHDDTEEDMDWLVKKMINLRIFSDEEGKMNLSLMDKKASVLLVSQFTLFAKTKKGNRPSFVGAASPEKAVPLYESAIKNFKSLGVHVETGEFGADMQVSLVNDGPVTIIIDTKNKE